MAAGPSGLSGLYRKPGGYFLTRSHKGKRPEGKLGHHRKITSVVNGASLAAEFSPGQWVTIQGTGLYSGSPQVLTLVNSSYPTSSNGLSVSMGGQPAHLYSLSSSQLNVIAPALSGSGSVP